MNTLPPQELINRLRVLRNSSLADYTEFVRSRMAPNTEIVNHMGFAIGLMAEAGEYGDLVKKERLHARPNSDEHKDKKRKELGDVFWYLFAACIVEGFDPTEVMAQNVEKLTARALDPAYAAKNPNVPTNVEAPESLKVKAERLREAQVSPAGVWWCGGAGCFGHSQNHGLCKDGFMLGGHSVESMFNPYQFENNPRNPKNSPPRLGDAECHACGVEPIELGAGFVECRICGTTRKLGDKHGCKAAEPKTGSGCG